jgi:uncharacterized protein YkwD
MTRRRFTAIVAALAVALAVLPAGPARAANPTAVMIEKLNSWRASRGLPTLRASESLMTSSRRYAATMMRRGYFGHASSVQASSRYRRLGEVIYMRFGSGSRPSLAFRSWLRSSGHRSLLAHRGFTQVGAGYVAGRFRGRRAVIWVMQFGKP